MKRRQFIVNSGILTAGLAGLSPMSLPTDLKKIVPRALKMGDTIALTAPAGAVFSPKHISKMTEMLKKFGFKVVLGKTLSAKNGYLAGPDEMRAAELNQYFEDKNIQAIFTMRGGWGCGRILSLLDYDMIRRNPKIIMGFSDITSLLIAITEKTGLITFHGPVGYSSWNDFSTQHVYSTIVEGKRTEFINATVEEVNLKTLTPGKAEGEIIAGNLTVLCSLIGTAYEPDWTGKILCLEEIGEEPYRIDRMLWQMKSNQVFEKVSGIVLGAFRKCNPEFPEESFSLVEVIHQYFKDTRTPAYMGASFGHVKNKFNLPVGAKAFINADTFQFELLESATVFNG
ncbi:MAG: LD-carboxypeptidase [Crocinitomicaceae bacterium]